MPIVRPRRSRFRALAAVKAHFRETGHPPSLSDLARRLKCSKPRASELVADLEAQGLITRTPGAAFSIRLVERPSNLSDAELAHEIGARLRSRDPDIARAIGQALRSAIPYRPLTSLELPADAAIAHLLVDLSGGGDDGESNGTQAERAA